MKSIRTKFLILIICSILLCGIAVGGSTLLTSGSIIDENAEQLLISLSKNSTNSINSMMSGIEQSINISYDFARRRLETPETYIESPEKLDDFVAEIRDILENTAENTDGALTAYIRLNPDLGFSNGGAFIVRNEISNSGKSDNGSGFTDYELTDISKYDKDDIEHVGWYYIPIEKGKGTWIGPYHNYNLGGIYIISYIVPIFKDGEAIGVIGMDIDMNLLINEIDSIKAYDTGFAFLCDEEGNIVYHKNFPNGVDKEEFGTAFRINPDKALISKDSEIISYKNQNYDRILVGNPLSNGMNLMITVPKAEFNDGRNLLIRNSLLALVSVLLLTTIITMIFVKIIVKPIRHLTDISKRIATGDLDVEIVCRSKDEVGTLANSYKETVKMLKGYIDRINKQAFTDAATGVGNKAAYADAVQRAEIVMRHNDARFAVLVMDINYLKMYNDKYGHEFGDMLISDATSIIRSVFDDYQIFRIGGDEFAVIILNHEEGICEKLTEDFKEALKEFNSHSTKYELGVQIAIGWSEFRPESDRAYATVFNRADKMMYTDKQNIKKNYHADGYVDNR